MAVIFDDQTRQWFMALTLRGESFSMPLGDPLPMEREGGCSEDQLGLDLPQPETNATACGAVSGTSAACALANCADCEQKQAAPSAVTAIKDEDIVFEDQNCLDPRGLTADRKRVPALFVIVRRRLKVLEPPRRSVLHWPHRSCCAPTK